MAYIAPNSIVQLIRGIPWNNTYNDSVIFASAAAQHTAITTSVKYTFNAQSYQRAGKNKIKLNVLCDNIYDCNYMCFQNTSYSNKWFYAFIIDVEYINNDTTLVTYQLDVLQTWMFDYTVLPCFIERQHTTTDAIGDNIIEENLECGELVFNQSTSPVLFTDYAIVFVTAFSATWDASTLTWTIDPTGVGLRANSCFSGYNFIVCKDDPVTGDTAYDKAKALINDTTIQEMDDGILGIFMYPSAFITENAAGNYDLYQSNAFALKYAKPGTTYGKKDLDGYTPKNKKLYSYPFSQLMVTDGGNQAVTLKYEYFKEPFDHLGRTADQYSFNYKAETAFNPTVTLMPEFYKSDSNREIPYNAILMTGFPMCSWRTDTFKAYIAQTYGPALAKATPERTPAARAVAGGIQAASGIAKDVTGLASDIVMPSRSARSTMEHSTGFMSRTAMGAMDANTAIIGGVLSALDTVFSKVSDVSTKFMEPNQAHGNVTDTSGVNFGFKNFHINEMCIKSNYAKIVDDYFSMFGYAIHAIGTPRFNARPNWTYVKTVGAKIDGNIPFDHESVICAILDKGITWWNGIDKYGRYDLDNSPLT